MLHVHPREVEAGRLQQRQDRRIAHHVDPRADLQFAAFEGGAQWIGLHVCSLQRLHRRAQHLGRDRATRIVERGCHV